MKVVKEENKTPYNNNEIMNLLKFQGCSSPMMKTRVSFITSILKFQNCRQNGIYGKQLRKLTLFGKALIIKSLGLSQIVQAESNVNVKIKRESIHQDCNKGRIRLTDVDLMIKILRLAQIPRLLKPDGRNWKSIPDFFL